MAKKNEKSTKAVVIMHKLKVEEWLRDGFTRADILQNVAKSGWKLSNSTIDVYIRAVKDSWLEMAKADSKYNFCEANVIRQRLYIRAMAKGDLSTASRVRDSLDKIRGVMKETIKHEGIDGIEKQDLDKLIGGLDE